MSVDRTGRMVTSKEFIRSLVIASIEDAAFRVRVDVERQPRDASGRNWRTVVESDGKMTPEVLRRLQGIVGSLMAAYNLPSEKAE